LVQQPRHLDRKGTVRLDRKCAPVAANSRCLTAAIYTNETGKLGHQGDASAQAETWVTPSAARDFVSQPPVSIDNATPKVSVHFEVLASCREGLARHNAVLREIGHNLSRGRGKRAARDAIARRGAYFVVRLQECPKSFQVVPVTFAKEQTDPVLEYRPVRHQEPNPIRGLRCDFSEGGVVHRQMVFDDGIASFSAAASRDLTDDGCSNSEFLRERPDVPTRDVARRQIGLLLGRQSPQRVSGVQQRPVRHINHGGLPLVSMKGYVSSARA
jgi:hypothetical protein